MKMNRIKYTCLTLLSLGIVGFSTAVVDDVINIQQVQATSTNDYQSNIDVYYNGQPYTKRPLFDGMADIKTSNGQTTATIPLSDIAKKYLSSIVINGKTYQATSDGKITLPVNSDGSFSDMTVNISVPGLVNESQNMQLRIAKTNSSVQTSNNVTSTTNVDDKAETKTESSVTDQPINVGDYSYQVLKEDSNDGISTANQFFTQKTTVKQAQNGEYIVGLEMKTPVSYGSNTTQILSINNSQINKDDITTYQSGDYYYMAFDFTVKSLDELNNLVPAKIKVDIDSYSYHETYNINFKFSKSDGDNNTQVELPIVSGLSNDKSNGGSAPSLPSFTGVSSSPMMPSSSGNSGSSLPSYSGMLPQTSSKALPQYISYAGFILLSIAMFNIARTKFSEDLL
ncbi:hypothetical protein [Lactobacillus terrae]|uniref:hypothetical protein n=1 Tax=Lactobacillus terrae TaxID=2269374 RepID=UPI000C1B6DD6|nr:hypothetical protein [Lactobacillus terrae]